MCKKNDGKQESEGLPILSIEYGFSFQKTNLFSISLRLNKNIKKFVITPTIPFLQLEYPTFRLRDFGWSK